MAVKRLSWVNPADDAPLQITAGDVEMATILTFGIEGYVSGVITPKGSINGTDYYAALVYPIGSATGVTTIGADGIWRADLTGLLGFQLDGGTAVGTMTAFWHVCDG